jgi:ABC-type branched-subunit amino acid transport system substrate-binding protein
LIKSALIEEALAPRRCGRILGAGLVFLVLLASGGRVRAAKEIVIGMSAAFKGPSRGLGIELYRGSMCYFLHINDRGGVGGRKIVVKAYNDGYNPRPAIENTIRLVTQDKVFLLYGYVGTPTVTRVLPLLKRYRQPPIYLFFPFTGAEPQRQPPYDRIVFNLRASYRQETDGLVENFMTVRRKRIAVFYQIDAYGRSGWAGVRRALAKYGTKMAGEATYIRGTPYSASMRAQVDLLRKAQPDAVISVGAYAACAAFIRDARDVGWDVPIANVSFVGSENMLDLLLKTGKAKGKDYTKGLITSQVVPSYNNLKLSAVREYRDLMMKYNPRPPQDLVAGDYEPFPYSFVSFEGFLNAKLLVEVFKRMGPHFERIAIKDVVEGIKGFSLGINQDVTFAADKHQGLEGIYYTEVERESFVPLRDWWRYRK